MSSNWRSVRKHLSFIQKTSTNWGQLKAFFHINELAKALKIFTRNISDVTHHYFITYSSCFDKNSYSKWICASFVAMKLKVIKISSTYCCQNVHMCELRITHIHVCVKVNICELKWTNQRKRKDDIFKGSDPFRNSIEFRSMRHLIYRVVIFKRRKT